MLKLKNMYVAEEPSYIYYMESLKPGKTAYVYDSTIHTGITFKGKIISVMAPNSLGACPYEMYSDENIDYIASYIDNNMNRFYVGIKAKPCMWIGRPESTDELSHHYETIYIEK